MSKCNEPPAAKSLFDSIPLGRGVGPTLEEREPRQKGRPRTKPPRMLALHNLSATHQIERIIDLLTEAADKLADDEFGDELIRNAQSLQATLNSRRHYVGRMRKLAIERHAAGTLGSTCTVRVIVQPDIGRASEPLTIAEAAALVTPSAASLRVYLSKGKGECRVRAMPRGSGKYVTVRRM